MSTAAAHGTVALGEVAAAVLVLQPFVGLCVLLVLLDPPTPMELAAADPLVRALLVASGPWSLPLVGAVAGLGWWTVVRPDAGVCLRAWRQATMALVVAITMLIIVRVVGGPVLPGHGRASEEAVFRLGLLGVLLARGCRRSLAVAVTSLAFAWRTMSSRARQPSRRPTSWRASSCPGS